MNSMKLVIPLPSLYWSIHTKDESKRGTAFAFIFGVNWLWRCGVTSSFGVFFNEIKCHGMTSFMEFLTCLHHSFLSKHCPAKGLKTYTQSKHRGWERDCLSNTMPIMSVGHRPIPSKSNHAACLITESYHTL